MSTDRRLGAVRRGRAVGTLAGILVTLMPKLKTRDSNYSIDEEKNNRSKKKVVDRIVNWFGNRSTKLKPC